jgi:hypothetical protein
MSDCPPPTLPGYEPPKPRIPAILPKDLEKLSQPHGIFNKAIGKVLKMPKLNPFKMMSMKKVPKPFQKKQKKSKVL